MSRSIKKPSYSHWVRSALGYQTSTNRTGIRERTVLFDHRSVGIKNRGGSHFHRRTTLTTSSFRIDRVIESLLSKRTSS